MMNFPAVVSAPSDHTACADPLRLAVVAYLARFKGSSRSHTGSDLRCFLSWCAEHGLDSLAARRPHLESGARTHGPILLNSRGARMDRHAATGRLRRLAETAGVRIARPHPHMLRHTFVTTMLDAGADLRDVQIAARHADPRTTMRYDRARKNLDRHPNYILAAYMASGT
jgi:site-specific recombinase XerD